MCAPGYRTKDQGALSLHDPSGHVTPLIFGKDYLVGGSPWLSQQMGCTAGVVGFGLVRRSMAATIIAGWMCAARSWWRCRRAKFLQTENGPITAAAGSAGAAQAPVR